MTFEEIKALDHQYVMQSYGRFDVAVDHGRGATLWDTQGREYIDFTSGIGVCSLGYADEGWVNAITEQAGKLGHISNLFYAEPYVKAAEKLCRKAGMSNVFFANSGAESNEGLIKLARKYSFDKYGKGRGTIITLHKSFHGRTITTLSATGQDVFHNYFFPFTEGFRHADANDFDSVEAMAGHDVCAVMFELIQGEGGVLPLDREFVQKVADLCAKRDWLLLIDEVQTGVGRTGSLFAFQQYGIQPDAVSFAKGIAGGLPFGGVMAGEKCRNVFTTGTHGTTFGGNPISAAAACYVLDRMDGAMFQSVTPRTAGYATIPQGDLMPASKIATTALMFIGASPSGTGGGIKTSTFFVLMQEVRSLFTKKHIGAFHRSIPAECLSRASIISLLSLLLVCVGTFLLCILEPDCSFIQLFFEEVSAFGTVGLSTGITPTLCDGSKLVLIFTMFAGRVGMFTLLSIWIDRPAPNAHYTEESITIG